MQARFLLSMAVMHNCYLHLRTVYKSVCVFVNVGFVLHLAASDNISLLGKKQILFFPTFDWVIIFLLYVAVVAAASTVVLLIFFSHCFLSAPL